MGRFDGKAAIVTGAAGGIGEEYAKALAGEGAQVVVADVSAEGGERVANEIVAAGGQAFFQHSDVSEEESANACADACMAKFGRLDLLVNNAAIFGGMKLDFLITVPWDYYEKFMSVNLNGQLLMVRACHEKMAANGGGAIVNQSSTAAWLYSGFYGLAKVGINGLTQQLATELGGSNVRINAIAPGPIDTEANRSSTPQSIVNEMVDKLPLKRIGQPKDLVGMLLFLLSDEADWVTGQIFNVDGGQVIRS